MFVLEDLQQMSYKELQKLAKATGACRANAKSADMIQSLVQYYQSDAVEVVEAPVIEEAAAVEVEAPVIEAPAVEDVVEAPVIEEAPAVEEVVEVPVVEETATVEEVPVVEETATVEEVPVVEETATAVEEPLAEEVQTAEDSTTSGTESFCEKTLRSLSRSELQAMAKETGACKGNLSTVKIIDALLEFGQLSTIAAPAITEKEVSPVAELPQEQTIFDGLSGALNELEIAPIVDVNIAPAVAKAESAPSTDDYGLDALMNKFSDVLVVTNTTLDDGKCITRVKCELTEHEMPLDFEKVCDHVGGPVFTRRYKDWQNDWADQMQYYGENENHAAAENAENAPFNGKLNGVATPKGKKTVFKSPNKTPAREYEKFNTHWSIDDYSTTTAN